MGQNGSRSIRCSSCLLTLSFDGNTIGCLWIFVVDRYPINSFKTHCSVSYRPRVCDLNRRRLSAPPLTKQKSSANK